LEQNGWEGQIVGPHGSGKSVLAAALIDALVQSGRQAVLVELHDGQRRLPKDLPRMSELDRGTVLIVDGYEQLGFWGRFLLRRSCCRRRLPLVVTSHASVGFPDLFRTAISLRLAQQIVEELLGDRAVRVTSAEVSERFARHQGNLREVLFDLYDLYEQRQRGGDASSDGSAFKTA